MQKQRSTLPLTALIVSLILLCTFLKSSEALPPPICSDERIALSPYAQKLCAALSNISEFSRAMEEYLDAKLLRHTIPVNEPEVKRQDLDHVFLRFGRSHK
ncbi:UNVERIFIED_CONTAM: hypothetical protein RMT77_006467 [Armadillidium vulgare]